MNAISRKLRSTIRDVLTLRSPVFNGWLAFFVCLASGFGIIISLRQPATAQLLATEIYEGVIWQAAHLTR
jgi:hypothetical protein